MAEVSDTLDVSNVKDNFLECSVCLEHFDQEERRPRLLVNCLHAFCSQCLEQLLEREGGGQVTCPNCRQVQQVKGTAKSLPVDPVRNKLVDYVKFKKEKKIPCTDCPDGSHAVVRCHDCQTYMCTQCKEAHHRNRSTRKHECKSMEETLSEPIRNFLSHFCKVHPDHKIEFYCGKCSSLCCVSCSIVKHKGHNLEPIEDAANSMLSSLKTKLEETENSATVLRSKKTSLEKEFSQQELNLKQATFSINQTFEQMISKLKMRQNELIKDLQQKTESTVNSLKKQQEATEDSLAQMESALGYFKQMESKSDDCEVLSAGPVLIKSLQAAAAKNQCQDVQHPTWAFSAGEMTDIISKLHTYGGILSGTNSLSKQICPQENKGAVGGMVPGRSVGGKDPRNDSITLRYSNDTVSLDFDLPGGIMVKVHYGDIMKIRTAGIVNAANSKRQHYGGIARAFEEVSGRNLTREYDRYVRVNGPLNVSEVMHTTLGNLNAVGSSFVMHTVGPVYMDTIESRFSYLLTCTFQRCLDYGRKKLRIRSIAFPFISTGHDVPLDICVESFLDAVVLYAKNHRTDTCLKEICLVDSDMEKIQTAIVMIKQHLEQGFEQFLSKAAYRLDRKNDTTKTTKGHKW